MPIVLTLVVLAATALLQVPGLDIGWWGLIGGQGNPALGATDQTAGTFLEWLVPAIFLMLLAPAVPLLALREEETFRQGAEGWSNVKRAGRSVLFGLAHALIGIPIGVALALSFGGAYFTLVYLRGFRAHRQPARRLPRERAGAHDVQPHHRAARDGVAGDRPAVAVEPALSRCGARGSTSTPGANDGPTRSTQRQPVGIGRGCVGPASSASRSATPAIQATPPNWPVTERAEQRRVPGDPRRQLRPISTPAAIAADSAAVGACAGRHLARSPARRRSARR